MLTWKMQMSVTLLITDAFLELSTAYESVDHDTLLQRLQTSYGLGGNVRLVLLDVHSTSGLRRLCTNPAVHRVYFCLDHVLV